MADCGIGNTLPPHREMHRYRQFDHTADLGVEAFGKTPNELFANAAFAVFDILTDLKYVKLAVEKNVAVDGDGWADLLVNYLREVLYLYNGEGLLLKEFKIGDIDSRHLEGRVMGEPFDPAKHRINTEIKAVTYHQASVKEDQGLWRGRVIFDV